MRYLILTICLFSQIALAAGKCVQCEQIESALVSRDVRRGALILANFRFTSNDILAQEADAITRLTIFLLPEGDEIIEELYYRIYQQRPAAMEGALKRVSPAERRKLKDALQGWAEADRASKNP